MERAMRVERKTEVRNGIKRGLFALFAIIVELVWVYIVLRNLTGDYPWIPLLIHGLAFILVLGIYGRHINSAMKMPWILLIAGAPFLGVPLYLLIGFNGATRRMRWRYERIDAHLFPAMPQQGGILEELESVDYGVANQFRYLSDRLGYPVYRDTDICFYPTAEEAFEAQLEALEKAERFIFMEYHAIEEKTAFERLFKVLSERAAAGVEVRLFYDDIGSIWFIDHDFIRRMEEAGIQTRVFNPMTPLFNAFLDHRDHRKITVIDGKVGFTGGYNLAEEYFNITHPYGHWFDTGIRLTGEAVRSLTGIFLENWNAIRGERQDVENLERYLSLPSYCAAEPGYCQPYADSPLDGEQVGENVYMNLVNHAKRYVYFMTPYLIITDEMSQAFCLAAKRGVDVRIITPGIPDKKMVYQATRSYYNVLTRAGVRIYEYTPGFMHAKQCVADDELAACGTINLDFRSLYHHFENGVLFYRYRAIAKMKQCFLDTFPLCREVTEQYLYGRTLFQRAEHCLLRFISPML